MELLIGIVIIIGVIGGGLIVHAIRTAGDGNNIPPRYD